MRRTATLLLSLLLTTSAFAVEEELVGEWKLNFDQSENLGALRLDVDMTVALEGENLALTRVGTIEGREEPFKEGYTYVANGKAHTITDSSGRSRDVKARWQGDRLKITWEGVGRFGAFDAIELWQMDGDQLYIKTTFKGAGGAFTMKSYYDRKKE